MPEPIVVQIPESALSEESVMLELVIVPDDEDPNEQPDGVEPDPPGPGPGPKITKKQVMHRQLATASPRQRQL